MYCIKKISNFSFKKKSLSTNLCKMKTYSVLSRLPKNNQKVMNLEVLG